MAPSVTPIVIDNASNDVTVAEARSRSGVRVIANAENRGFAAAVNQGVRACTEEYLLMLNPDTQLLTAIDDLTTAAHSYGLACGKLQDKTGNAQAGFTIRRFPTPMTFWFELTGLNRLWPSNHVNRRYRYLDRDLGQPGLVEQPAGAFLMFRRDVWEKLGGLDEGFYPVWFEDVDFCFRAAHAGHKISYIPSVCAEHLGGHSVGRIPVGCRLRYWCASLLVYAGKHFSRIAYRGICLLVAITSVPRTVAGMMRERSLIPIFSCIRIVGFAIGGFALGRHVSPHKSGKDAGLVS